MNHISDQHLLHSGKGTYYNCNYNAGKHTRYKWKTHVRRMPDAPFVLARLSENSFFSNKRWTWSTNAVDFKLIPHTVLGTVSLLYESYMWIGCHLKVNSSSF